MTNHIDTANARSRFFQLTALGFNHPVEEFHRVLVDGSYTQALLGAAAGAGCIGHFAHREEREFRDFEADYIHLFQMGRGGKPLVALNAGDHDEIAQGRGRPELLLEYSDWYRHFGLRVNTDDSANELPDHLACQIEFMAWLAHLEETAAEHSEPQAGYRRAQRDFLQRHLQPFLEVLVVELKEKAGRPRVNTLYLALATEALEVNDNILAQLEDQRTDSSDADEPEQIATVNLWG